VTVPPRACSRSPKFSAKASCCSSVMAVEDQHGIFVHAGLDVDRLLLGQGFP
jgi:hypothetical protein